MRSAGVPKGAPDVAPGVQYSVDRDGSVLDVKGDRHAAFEADHAQSYEKFVPADTSLREFAKASTEAFDCFDVRESLVLPGSISNEIIEIA